MAGSVLTDAQIKMLVIDVFDGNIPFNRHAGFEIDLADVDGVKICFNMKEMLVGNFMHGILHGGVSTSALDVVGGLSVFIHMAKNMPSETNTEQMRNWFSKLATIDMRVDFLRPGAGSRFTASSTVLRAGARVAVTRMDLVNEEGTLIAAATATYTYAGPTAS